MFWGGLRGAISLALVLSLPLGLQNISGKLQAMVFGLVIFTLLVQGTSMGVLIKWLRVAVARPSREEYDLRRARTMSVKAGYQNMRKAHADGMISNRVWNVMSLALEGYLKGLSESMHELLSEYPNVEAEELDAGWREFLQHQRLALTGLYNDRTISDEAYSELSSRVDELLASQEINWNSIEDLSNSLWNIDPGGQPEGNQ
jgi:CPA1 family monovalent cation:H+ antiporter